MTKEERRKVYYEMRTTIKRAIEICGPDWHPYIIGTLMTVAKAEHYTAAKKGIYLIEFTRALNDLEEEGII